MDGKPSRQLTSIVAVLMSPLMIINGDDSGMGILMIIDAVPWHQWMGIVAAMD